uniref:Uncharacterized protein n=1 Tax=Arundo donax TaxID=35708 RepID=A0A0A8Z9I3_ARUDO
MLKEPVIIQTNKRIQTQDSMHCSDKTLSYSLCKRQ